LRHTCATLLLQAAQPVHVVSQRLGHSKVEMTLNIYAHVRRDSGSLVGQNIASWNQLAGWLREIAALREAA
jgi:integrase